jgi:hypothetical protein
MTDEFDLQDTRSDHPRPTFVPLWVLVLVAWVLAGNGLWVGYWLATQSGACQ